MLKKESFVFYETFWEQLQDLDDKQQLKFLGGIIEYGLYNKKPQGLTKLEMALWKTFEFAIDNAKARRAQNIENGRKGGRPCKQDKENNYDVDKTVSLEIIEKPLSFNNPEKPKKTENNPEKPNSNLNVNVDVNVDGNVDINEYLNPNVYVNTNVDEYVNSYTHDNVITNQQYSTVNDINIINTSENINGEDYKWFFKNFHEGIEEELQHSKTFYLYRQEVNLNDYELGEKEKLEIETKVKQELKTLLERTHYTDKKLGLVFIYLDLYGQDQFINFRKTQELKIRGIKLKSTSFVDSEKTKQNVKVCEKSQITYNSPENTSCSPIKGTNHAQDNFTQKINKTSPQPYNAPKKQIMKSKEYTTTYNRHTKFKKPSIEEIRTYCDNRHNGIDAIVFYDFYESVGWKIGKSDMYSWQATIRNWEHRRKQKEKEEAKKLDEAHDFSQEALDRFFASA